jgi:hypothetical protein
MFLQASGIIGADCSAVEHCVRAFASAHGGVFEECPQASGDDDRAVVAESGSNTTILYPDDFSFWEELSNHISKDLQVPVFAFHIHDGDLWLFILFSNGQAITQFNPISDYWKKVDSEEKKKWAGDVQTVCQLVPGLSPETIRNYFVEWTETIMGSGRKAYPDDEFEYGVDWQMTDFMRRVGLVYPVDNDGTPIGRTFRLRIGRK